MTTKNHLSDFFLDPETEYGKSYKNILKKFIERQNNELTELLENKIISGKIDVNSANKINIQQIKEDEIFTFNIPEKFSFINETSNSSYRKIIDNKNYEIYNKYEIDFDSIEDNMTNLLLKNKNLLKDDIIEFSYNNELFTNEVSDIITTFKNNYNNEEISDDDRVVIYKYIDSISKNKDYYKKIIDDFITLIKYLGNRKEENIMISEINSKIENNVSKEFIQIFENQKYLTIDKTYEIFEYFLNLIFIEIKEEIEEFNIDFKDKEKEQKLKDELDKFFEIKDDKDNEDDNNNNDEKKIITKDNLAYAIKLFISLVLFGEKDKENKIKENKKNIFNYLNAEDLWSREVYKDPKFIEELNKLKEKYNIQMSKIIWFYDYLVEDVEEYDYKGKIEEYLKKKEQKNKPVEAKDKGQESSEESESKSESESDEDKSNSDEEAD